MTNLRQSFEDRRDGLCVCPVCGSLNDAATSNGIILCRNCRSSLLVHDDVVELISRSRRYLFRHRLGTLFVWLGGGTLVAIFLILLFSRPSPLFGDCFFGCGPPTDARWITAIICGLTVTLTGLFLRRRRWQ